MTIALVAVLVAVTVVSLAVIVFLGRSVRHWTAESRRLMALAERHAAELREELARRGLAVDEGAPGAATGERAGTVEHGRQEERGPERAGEAGAPSGGERSEGPPG